MSAVPEVDTGDFMGDGAGTGRISIQCRCGKRLNGPASAIGRTIMCPACGRRLRLAARRTAQQSSPHGAPQDPYELEAAGRCENCGVSLPAGAVMCVQCGYDLRQGQVVSRAPARKRKKARKRSLRFELPARRPLVLAISLGATVLIVTGVFFAVQGGSPNAESPTGTVSVAASTRAAEPEPSKDPKDWRSSVAAFAANLSAQAARDPSGRPRWEVRGGQISFAQEAEIEWEGVLFGRDRRPVVSMTRSEATTQAFGFGFPKLAALPDSFAILFAIDENRAPELARLTYRRVRIKGTLDPVPYVVWLDRNGEFSSCAPAPPLQPDEVSYLDWGAPDGIKPIYVMWFNIKSFQLAK